MTQDEAGELAGAFDDMAAHCARVSRRSSTRRGENRRAGRGSRVTPVDRGALPALVEDCPSSCTPTSPTRQAVDVISPRVEQVFGYPADAWLDAGFFDCVIHPEDRNGPRESRHLDSGDERWSLEYRVFAADGRLVWVRDDAWIVRDEDGEPTHFQGFMIDITAENEGSAELDRQKHYFESLVDISPVAVVTMDRDEVVTGWNPAATSLFGYPTEEAIGTISELVLDSEDLPPDAAIVPDDVLAAGRIDRVTQRARKDGSLVDVEVSMVPLHFEGDHAGFYAIYRDITAVKQAETRFRRLAEELPLVTYIDAPLGTSASSGDLADSVAGENLYTSPQAEELFGYPVEEWRDNLLWERILHPDDRDWVIEAALEAQRTFAPLTLGTGSCTPTGERSGSAMPRCMSSTTLVSRCCTSRASSWSDRAHPDERTQAALRSIAETASAAEDMQSFYAEIHRIVGELMYAENLFIALYDEARHALNFPYYVDSVDPESLIRTPGSRLGTGLGRGSTAYVIRTGLPLLVTSGAGRELVARGEIELVGADSSTGSACRCAPRAARSESSCCRATTRASATPRRTRSFSRSSPSTSRRPSSAPAFATRCGSTCASSRP